MLSGVNSRLFARGPRAAAKHGHSTTDSFAAKPLLRVTSPLAQDPRSNTLHLIFAVELHFFQLNLFQEVFRIQVRGFGDSLEFCFVLPVLLCQTLILGVCLKNYVPRCPLRASHAFLLTTM